MKLKAPKYGPDEVRYKESICPAATMAGKCLEALCEHVYTRLLPGFTHKPQAKSRGAYLKQLGWILMNLLRGVGLGDGPGFKVAIPYTPKSYRPNSGLGRRKFTAPRAKELLNGLKALGLVIQHAPRTYLVGDFGDMRPRQTATFWSTTPDLCVLFDSFGLVPEILKHGNAAKGMTIVRGADRQHVHEGEKYTRDRQEHDKGLRLVNDLLCATPATFDVEAIEATSDEEVRERYRTLTRPDKDRTRCTVYRVYKRDREHGGRFAGHRLQNIPKVLRRGYILMGGLPVAEADFRSFNVSLIFALEKLELPTSAPYQWPGCAVERDVVKSLLNAALNAKDEHSAVGGVLRDLAREKYTDSHGVQRVRRVKPRYPYPTLMRALQGGVAQLPPEVQGYFFSGFGDEAMWYESEIAYRVLVGMAKEGVAVVPLHDGFIAQEPHKGLLTEHMRRASREMLSGVELGVDLKWPLVPEVVPDAQPATTRPVRGLAA